MGSGDACPIYPGKLYEDWNVADPAGQPLEVVRDIRDDAASLGGSRRASSVGNARPAAIDRADRPKDQKVFPGQTPNL
jgi:hypothetical protein